MQLVTTGLLVLFVLLSGYLGISWWLEHRRAIQAKDAQEVFKSSAEKRLRELNHIKLELESQVHRLKPWEVVANADDKARELITQANQLLEQAKADARILIENAETQFAARLEAAHTEASTATAEGRAKAKQLTEQAQSAMNSAAEQAEKMIAAAKHRADQIAGDAYKALHNAEHYEKTARAMKNIIKGYGDEYLVPAASLLDDLAEEYSHKDAGQQLKHARKNTKALITQGNASECKYVEQSRREGAERFVLDAFNGKVDSILSRVKHDNAGKLETEIRDAFTIVNHGGKAFREARITVVYLDARMQELKWAAITQELKLQEREEQRRIREQIREEDKARREFEKAIKEAAREESMLKKAMAKAEAKLADASAEQQEEFEAQLAELRAQLTESEEKNQRAISMAQQTRRGHVYVISNVGSFGEDIFKIGLTRRLEPMDRIKELGDASVPFGFDVHAIIMSDDAPSLENKLHKHFVLSQLNKVNHRKEFFRASISDIRDEIQALGIEAKWTLKSEALEFRETLAIEKAIDGDPDARAAWLNRQLDLDPVNHAEMMAAIDD